jgi:hypothetical protein
MLEVEQDQRMAQERLAGTRQSVAGLEQPARDRPRALRSTLRPPRHEPRQVA